MFQRSAITCFATVFCLVVGPSAKLVRAAPAPPVEYVFIAVPDQLICHQWKSRKPIGRIDAKGQFNIERQYSAEDDQGGSGTAFVVIVHTGRERVYEFRSDRLILGTMMPDGEFIPEAGSTVIEFKDFKYEAGGTPIWNLPGYFLRRDKFDQRRKWLADHAGKDPELLAEKARLDAAVADKR
jgi:hypothetical protein